MPFLGLPHLGLGPRSLDTSRLTETPTGLRRRHMTWPSKTVLQSPESRPAESEELLEGPVGITTVADATA